MGLALGRGEGDGSASITVPGGYVEPEGMAVAFVRRTVLLPYLLWICYAGAAIFTVVYSAIRWSDIAEMFRMMGM